MRLIDADALEKYLSDAEIEATRQRKYVFASALNTICGNVRNFPTIKPERKKGKWIDYSEDGFVECSFCHSATNCEGNKDELHYCFCCGADMRGEQR